MVLLYGHLQRRTSDSSCPATPRDEPPKSDPRPEGTPNLRLPDVAGVRRRSVRAPGPSAASVRSRPTPRSAFIQTSYPAVKKANPEVPILIREALGTPARAFARFGQSALGLLRTRDAGAGADAVGACRQGRRASCHARRCGGSGGGREAHRVAAQVSLEPIEVISLTGPRAASRLAPTPAR